MDDETHNRGMITFFTLWFGQLISLIGSGLSEFALGVWIYQRTDSATQFALLGLFIFLPQVVVTMLAGVMADRHSRRSIMIWSNLVGALATGLLALLVIAGVLQVWLVYVVVLLFSISNAMLYPAYNASVPTLVSKKHLGRANGLLQLATSISRTLAPLAAGFLLGVIHLQGIVLADCGTFLVAVVTLFLITIPQPAPTTVAGQPRPSIFRDAGQGLSYILARPGLLGLLAFFAVLNISAGFYIGLYTPLVLSFTSSAALGTVAGIGGVGLVVGSLVMSAWGGPKQRMDGVLGFGLTSGLALMLMGARASIVVVAIGSFTFFFFNPLVNACNMAIWMSKVPAEVRGRVMASIRLIAWSTVPLAILASGPLADNVFEPLMMPGGGLAGSVGQLIGVGHGRGIGLLLVIVGVLPVLAVLAAYLSVPVRRVEEQIPDAAPAAAGAGR